MLRRLEAKDAPYMLEWMHDESINRNFRYPFKDMTIEKTKSFIEDSFDDKNQHFAIVNEQDEYLGTISLKNISEDDKNAEYAIVTRRIAQGTGVTKQATDELLRYAFHKLGLYKVYLNVLARNTRARRLYEKCGFLLQDEHEDSVKVNGKDEKLVWYEIVKQDEVLG